MTNKQINARLEKLEDFVNDLICDLEEELENIQEKIEEIENKAYERESGENTKRELDRIDELNEKLEGIQYILDNLSIDVNDYYLDE